MVDIYGGIFLDVIINKKEIHHSTTKIKIGGSGFNIHHNLTKLLDDINFYANIGDDESGKILNNIISDKNANNINLQIKKGKTGIITYVNDKAFAVQRGVNDKKIDTINSNSKYCVITTEIKKETIKDLFEKDYEYYFIDVGPRPSILKDLNIPKNSLLIGNENESKIIDTNIIKLKDKGAQWDDVKIDGNKRIYKNTVGSGDMFTTYLIYGYLKELSKDKILKLAIEKSENFIENL